MKAMNRWVRISGSAPVEELSELLNMQEILGLGGNSETLTNSEDPYCEYCGVAMVERGKWDDKEPFTPVRIILIVDLQETINFKLYSTRNKSL